MRDLVIFIDSGDTLIDEATQVFENDGIVKASFIPGGRSFLLKLHQEVFLIALVADGKHQNFLNIYAEPEVRSCFDAWVVSELVGEHKPSALMFETAMKALGLSDADKRRIVMIGNHLARDVRGANEMGLTSIWFDWSPRYSRIIQHPGERSCYTVSDYETLYALLLSLDEKAARGEPLC